MKHILIIPFFITLFSFSQIDTITLENGKYEVGQFSNNRKNGTWIRYNVDGKTERVESYIDGQLDGEWKGYYADGNLEFYANFKNLKLIEFVYYRRDKNTNESISNKIIKSQEGLNQNYFWDILNRFKARDERLKRVITQNFRDQESIMIGKLINTQITKYEYEEFDKTRSEKAVKIKADSVLNDEIYAICLDSKSSNVLILCDEIGQYSEEFEFVEGEQKLYVKREFYSSKYNVAFSEITMIGKQIIKRENILNEQTYNETNYHEGSLKVKSQGKIVDGVKQGTWFFYSETGELLEKIDYKDGVRKK
jgi:antitoxin component YwqK of YwqJK toxin-antitoxin module